MVLSRTTTASFRSFFAAGPSRIAGARASSRVWQQTARRTYASEAPTQAHKSSDLPWIIGSLAVTVPSAYFLIQSGPDGKTDAHAHGHEEKHAAPAAEESAPEPVTAEEPEAPKQQEEAPATPAAEEEEKAVEAEEAAKPEVTEEPAAPAAEAPVEPAPEQPDETSSPATSEPST
ncbi:hypothetical protein AJ80_00660 [Polytolypa hystricis UAMH7299]|uniref:Uncharacterized protein n=1 Tax=Polytolypa hystricis (strain UAMH7299) TaxID=1447883 RepID=A0A2B7Z491_POLH7|nr:hypothetical protein AJ80_00660 [Polytolypa hystricis UAMH7299]